MDWCSKHGYFDGHCRGHDADRIRELEVLLLALVGDEPPTDSETGACAYCAHAWDAWDTRQRKVHADDCPWFLGKGSLNKENS